ncbi:MAG: helix-turn-helix domain-containing protein [Solobacterium sp.]|nr:helix-turn-helix domain-containing protein [Solobacterium sp.]
MDEERKHFDVRERIRQLREMKGWSAAKLSRETGIAQQTIGSWYRRGNYPPQDKLEVICDKLGVSLSQFFSRPGSFTVEGDDARILEKLRLLDDDSRKIIEGMADEFLKKGREKQNAG